MTDTQQIWISLGYILFMVVLAYLFKKYPPKNINWLYGYRTTRTMANQEIWDAANSFSLSKMFQWQLYCLFLPIIGYFLYPQHNVLVTIIIHTIVIIAIIPVTESYLNKRFDSDGNPK